MPLDIQAFREDQGGDVAKLIESQRRRTQPDTDPKDAHEAKKQIEAVIAIDNEWRRGELRLFWIPIRYVFVD